MDKLEDIAFRYLPRTLIQHWDENPDIRPVWGYWIHGSLMHCDVTGFTAMSEKLGALGKEGAELMAGVLNEFFERMLSIAISWGGIQIKFGGDAMLLYFPENDHAERSSACGLEMQSAMHEFARVRVKNDYHKLLMRIGVHSGRFYVCSAGQVGTKIGQGEGLLHYYIVGKDVNKAADTEPMAEPTQVVVSDTTYQLINNDKNKLLETEHKGIWLVKKIDAKKRRLKFFDDSALPHHVLNRYLMKPIADGISSGKSEHRRVTIIFIYVTGIAKLLEENEEKSLDHLDQYTNMIFSAAEKYGGHFAASDASEHGDKLIVLFGAPVLQDSQESSAMNFALEIRDKKNKLNIDLEHHIGINTGYVFSGEIGSTARREYTVIGDSVNLSARLMTAADVNEIIVSDFTAVKAKNEFDLEELEPIMVKGKTDPISICKLKGVKQKESTTSQFTSTPLVGRKKETDEINKVYLNDVGEKSSSLLLLGEAGIGKTRIAYEFILSKANVSTTSMSFCKAYNRNLAYSCIRKVILDIASCDEYENPEKHKPMVYDLVEQYANNYKVFFPLLSEIVGFDKCDNDVTNSFDNKTKREKRNEIIQSLIAGYAKYNPLIIFIDNLHWIDRTSKEILSSIFESDCKNIFLISTIRNIAESESVPESLIKANITIENLNKKGANDLLSTIYPLDDKALYDDIYGKSKGNPLFIIELISSGALESGEIPDTLYDIIRAKMDKLEPEHRQYLQSISVAGDSFKNEEVECLL